MFASGCSRADCADPAPPRGPVRKEHRCSSVTRRPRPGEAAGDSSRPPPSGPPRSPCPRCRSPARNAPDGRSARGVSAYGGRSRFEVATRRVRGARYDQAAGSLTPLQDLDGSLTPSELHFERHHAGIPDIDPAEHRLAIGGLVDRPLVFTMAELRRLPAVNRVYFIECSGNGRVKWSPAQPDTDAQGAFGMTSCSEWTGGAAVGAPGGGAGPARGPLAGGRGGRRVPHDPQRAPRQGDGRHPRRLGPERRGVAAGPGVPVAAADSGGGRATSPSSGCGGCSSSTAPGRPARRPRSTPT